MADYDVDSQGEDFYNYVCESINIFIFNCSMYSELKLKSFMATNVIEKIKIFSVSQ